MVVITDIDGVDEDIKLLIPLPHLRKFMALLMNPTVTEINLARFMTIDGDRYFNHFLLNYVLKNCPNISRVEFSDILRCYNNKPHMLPVERFKRSWSDLKSIITKDYICKVKTFRLIQQQFPNLESV
jgi:hypothetical protein